MSANDDDDDDDVNFDDFDDDAFAAATEEQRFNARMRLRMLALFEEADGSPADIYVHGTYVYSICVHERKVSRAHGGRDEPCRGEIAGINGDMSELLVANLHTPVFSYALARIRMSDIDCLTIHLEGDRDAPDLDEDEEEASLQTARAEADDCV